MSKFGKRRCVFCDGQPVTREHAIPLWLTRHPLFSEYVKNFDHSPRIQLRTQPAGSDVMLIQPQIFGTPQLNSITVKAVCKSCNGGWMSRLEDRVRAPLNALMTGSEDVIQAPDVEALHHWAIKSSFMFQLVDQTTRTVTQEQLQACAANPSAVPAADVFASRYSGEDSIWPCHGKFVISRASELRHQLGVCGVTTIVLGRLAIAVVAASNEESKSRIQTKLDPKLARWDRLERGQGLALDGDAVAKSDVYDLTSPVL